MTTEDEKQSKIVENETMDKKERTKDKEEPLSTVDRGVNDESAKLGDVEQQALNNKEGPQKEKQEEEEVGPPPGIFNRLRRFYGNNDFICQIILVILLARAYPPLGAEYLQPQITSTWIAVIFIFGTFPPHRLLPCNLLYCFLLF